MLVSSSRVEPFPYTANRKISTTVTPAIDLERQRTQLRMLRAINHWGSLVLIVWLVASQFACIFWSSQTSEQHMVYGQDPAKGTYAIDGFNDEPYSDRSVVCVLHGRLYKPVQLSAAVDSSAAGIVDTTGVSISGYRVVTRHKIQLRDEVAQRYGIACDLLAATLPAIAQSCSALGYDVVPTSDNLRIIDGIFSNTTQQIADSLPVLITPYWDNAVYARYVMPSGDGSACVFHLSGLFDMEVASGAWLSATNRSVREAKTVEWLRLAGKTRWRNGWLEDSRTGMRWYSDLTSSASMKDNGAYDMTPRQFDLLAKVEVNCDANPVVCRPSGIPQWWGDKFSTTDTSLWYNSIAISNGTRYGIFLYEALQRTVIHSDYDVAMLISNTMIGVLLFRWLAAVVVLLNAHRKGYSRVFVTPGVGCLACTRSFELLPILLLPRLGTVLAAFFTAGCKFEGEQRAISEAWFVIYPALAEVMLFYYSMLNALAKMLQRRVSDALFGPSLAFLCLLHLLRLPLANSDVFGFDGRIATVMTSHEYERLRLVDFFTTDAAFRLNGNVTSIFAIKIAVLALNLVPLAVARRVHRQEWKWNDATQVIMRQTTAVERAISMRASDSGGLGRSPLYQEPDEADTGTCDKRRRLECYELVRLGYIVFGDVVLLSLTDWLLIVLFGLTRSLQRMSSFRVLVFRVCVASSEPKSLTGKVDDDSRITLELERRQPRMVQLNDTLLLGTSVWDIAAVALP